MSNKPSLKQYWEQRWDAGQTGWDVGHPTPPIVEYINQLKNKNISILIPGAGSAYEAEYIWNQGFKNIFIIDIASQAIQSLKERIPNFPSDQIFQEDFFEHTKTYDLIIEQTFFCSFPPTKTNRENYAHKMSELLNPNGKLVGLWFNLPLTGDFEKRPFGGDLEEYVRLFSPHFEISTFEPSYNSIAPRQGTELFAIMRKKA